MEKLGIFEKMWIRLHPRYTEMKTSCFDFPVSFVDKSSFLSMYHEIFEREIYAFDSKRACPTIIDCGANIGLASIYFKKKYPDSKIIAFEPDPKIFKILKLNMEAGKFRDIALINKGLSMEGKEESFFSEGSDGGRVVRKGEENRKDIINIETEKLSSYLSEQIDFLKIDIEGSEVEVLKESMKKLENVRCLFVEYHSIISRKQNLDELLHLLTAAGFRYYIEQVGNKLKHPFKEGYNYLEHDLQLNIFAQRV